jgi:NAD(P)-dependent dehydrogenase (short-subunit alcohol dehydrogenase family)
VIIGAGPGIGQAVARRFAREGLPIALISRSSETLRAAAEAVASVGVPVVTATADSTDETALRNALDKAAGELGPPDVVVYNAALIQADEPGELSVRAHLDAWAVNVVGALTAAVSAPRGARANESTPSASDAGQACSGRSPEGKVKIRSQGSPTGVSRCSILNRSRDFALPTTVTAQANPWFSYTVGPATAPTTTPSSRCWPIMRT